MAETMSQQLLRFQLQSSRSANKSSQVPSSTNSNSNTSASSQVHVADTNSSSSSSSGGAIGGSSGPSLIISRAHIANSASVIGKKKVRIRGNQESSAKVIRKERFVW